MNLPSVDSWPSRLRDRERSRLTSVLDSSVDSLCVVRPAPSKRVLWVRSMRFRMRTSDAPSVFAFHSLAMGSSSLTLRRSSRDLTFYPDGFWSKWRSSTLTKLAEIDSGRAVPDRSASSGSWYLTGQSPKAQTRYLPLPTVVWIDLVSYKGTNGELDTQFQWRGIRKKVSQKCGETHLPFPGRLRS
jgi:hypothetical protein